jgi:hypothetical protein
MAVICTTISSWIGQYVLTPINTWVATQQNQQVQVQSWVNQQQQQCHQYPWWNPLGWFCWFITILVQVLIWVWRLVTVLVQAIVWVKRWILIPILTVTCNTIVGFIWLVLLSWSTAAISAVQALFNSSSSAWLWGIHWFVSPSGITFVQVSKSAIGINGATGLMNYDYTFTCNCHPWQQISITVQATNDNEAANLAEQECKRQC